MAAVKHARPLKKGDTIGIAAPSSPFERNEFMRGVHQLEKMGFTVHFRKDIFDQNRYLAGTDQRRAEELVELFASSKIAAIMFARGGYGSQRIIPLLDASTIAAHPKPVIGFSDITALLTFLRQACDIPTFYGPVLTMLGKHKEEVTAESLAAALTSAEPLGELPHGDAKVLKPGGAEGKLVGGCLSLIASSMGTPYELKTNDAVLFIEEIGEKMYAIDRMLTQLKNAGIFQGVRGIVVGSIVPHDGERYELEAILNDVLADFAGPIVTEFPAGHAHPFVTLPLGVSVRIHAESGAQPALIADQGSFT